MTEHTADLRREEIARIADVLRGEAFDPFGGFLVEPWAEALYDAGLRSQDTATARIAGRIENRATNLASAYWQKGEGHRERLRKDMAALHGRDYMVNTFARIDAIVAEELRAVLSGETRTDGETGHG